MKSDIEIAQSCKMCEIEQIAQSVGLDKDDISLYGKYKAKVLPSAAEKLKNKKNAKLILVTAVNPTPAGEGKTTTSIGLADSLAYVGKKAVLALREPSLGPVFGVKGGATGGGYAQVTPMEDINLHFTGDMHAITSANNLLCAIIDNHIQHGNELNIDPRRIVFKRAMDMNDRALRNIIVGLGGKTNGVPREDGFQITVASEIMAIMCLCENSADLKERFKNILVAYTYDNKPVFAGDLNAQGAMAALMKDAVNPNLVQTLNHTPALVHGGPFANIAHGCNSIAATKLAMKLGDYVVTEAGFGSDLGAQKFMDIKCARAGIAPSCAVVVATVRALRYNGKTPKDELDKKNVEAVARGLENLKKHVENMKLYNIPVLVAINRFESDSREEIDLIKDCCEQIGCVCSETSVFSDGKKGGVDLANKVIDACSVCSDFKPLCDNRLSLKDKMNIIAKKIYGANEVVYQSRADKEIASIESAGFSGLPVCVAKTQYSLSDDPSKLGRPADFAIHVSNVKLCSGAGFVVFYTGNIMTMPGLPKTPAAFNIDVAGDKIKGLF